MSIETGIQLADIFVKLILAIAIFIVAIAGFIMAVSMWRDR